GLGARMIGTRLADPSLDPVESPFVATLAPAFTELQPESAADLYMDGTARLLSEAHIDDLPRADELMRALDPAPASARRRAAGRRCGLRIAGARCRPCRGRRRSPAAAR